MDRPFDRPLIVGNGRSTITIASISEAGAFLLSEWPARKRRRESYRVALQSCVRALAGQIEPETARQALLAALADLHPRVSPVKNVAQAPRLERIRGRITEAG